MRPENAHLVVDAAAAAGVDRAQVVECPKPPRGSLARYRGKLVVSPACAGAREVFIAAGFRHLGIPGEDLFWWPEVAR